MRTRIIPAAVVLVLFTGGVFYASAASGVGPIPSCAVVRVSGGDFNGLVGGGAIAGIQVRNLATRDCTITGRPWIRLGPLLHPVTVSNATPAGLGSQAGAAGRLLTLRPGRSAVADIVITPGSCDLARSEVFALRARAGWARHGVTVSNLICDNGTGEVWVGSFRLANARAAVGGRHFLLYAGQSRTFPTARTGDWVTCQSGRHLVTLIVPSRRKAVFQQKAISPTRRLAVNVGRNAHGRVWALCRWR